MGFNGSPLATSVSRIATCIITAVYYYFWMPRAHPHLVQGHSYGDDLRGTEPEDILPAEEQGGEEESKGGAAASLRAPLLRHENGGGSNSSRLGDGNGNGNGNGSAATTTAAAAAAPSSNGGKIPFRQAFWRFLSLAIPGGIMVGLEAWSFDWTVSFSAQFGTENLDAHQSMMSVSAFTYLTVPLAVRACDCGCWVVDPPPARVYSRRSVHPSIPRRWPSPPPSAWGTCWGRSSRSRYASERGGFDWRFGLSVLTGLVCCVCVCVCVCVFVSRSSKIEVKVTHSFPPHTSDLFEL